MPAGDLSLINPKQAILDGMMILEEQLGTTITWAGQEFPCVGVTEDGGKRLDLGGFKLYADVRIKIRTGVFPPGTGLPQEKQTLLYKRGPDAEPIKLRIDSLT